MHDTLPSMRDLIDSVDAPEGDDELLEAGASRIVNHIREGREFFMVSAFRAYLERAENMRRTKLMRRMLANSGLAFIEHEGEYTEQIEGRPPTPSTEISFFVMPRKKLSERGFPKFENLAMRVMETFNQECVLVGDGERVYLLHPGGETVDLGDTMTFRPDVIAELEGSSLIGGKRYSFTSADHAAKPIPDEVVTKGTKYGSSKKVA